MISGSKDKTSLKNNHFLLPYGNLKFDVPLVMGILNITPDSFYDGGTYSNEKQQLKRVEELLSNGADIIDIGAISTRPGAAIISENEEINRLKPVIQNINKHFENICISIDTYRSTAAKMAIEYGAQMINDISGGIFDPKMVDIIAEAKVAYVIMHIQGNPGNMQNSPVYQNVTKEVKEFLAGRAKYFEAHGVQSLILDPGFGFGKTVEHNYHMLNNLREFKEPGYPLMVGLSRKSMINKVLNTTPKEALNGTTVLNTIALMNGADILRVHDVREAVECIRLVNELKKH